MSIPVTGASGRRSSVAATVTPTTMPVTDEPRVTATQPAAQPSTPVTVSGRSGPGMPGTSRLR